MDNDVEKPFGFPDTAIRQVEQPMPQDIDAPLNMTGSGWDPEVAQEVSGLPDLPADVVKSMSEELSDIDLLHRRINDLERLQRVSREEQQAAFQYLCQSMGWLVNMLSGVAQVAQNMPGVGGMMAKMLKGGK